MARRPVLQDISATPYLTRVNDTDSNLILLQEHILSASPEEQIIRQRSRRSLMLATALEVKGNQKVDASILHATPTRDDIFSQLTRKRLLMSPPRSAATLREKAKKPHLVRRLSSPINLQEELKPFTTEQLVTIIDRLVTSHPELESEVRDTLPAPDTKPMLDKLNQLRRNIFRSIPSTRWGSSRDAHCYKHVRRHLNTFRQACVEQGRVLIVAHHWISVLLYICSASRLVTQLPVWDDPSHNRTKTHCDRVLAAHCMVALKHSALSPAQYSDFSTRLEKAALINRELKPCVNYINKMLENNNYK